VTAETALVLPSLVGLGLALTFAVAATADRIRCIDAAWEAARLVARGETEARATAFAERLAPSAADVRIAPDGDAVTAEVTMRLAPLGRLLPGLSISGAAQIACEPGASCGSGSGSGSGPESDEPCAAGVDTCVGVAQ
jgi:hypothetical protein